MSDENPWLINTTDDTFDADVIERSKLGLVVLDFWADWCAPCRMLGPMLETLALEFKGEFTLVKAETDQNQTAASQFSVAGIPAVFAVIHGEVIDRFEGALPETALRDWLSSLGEKVDLQDAITLVGTDSKRGLEKLRSLCSTVERDEMLIRAAQVFLQQDCHDDVRTIVEKLEQRGFLEPEAEQLKSALALVGHAHSDPADLRARVASDPDDLESRLLLAKSLVGGKQYEEAFEICLLLVEQDRSGTGEEARALMVDVFKALPSDSALVAEYRRKLSMLLF